MTVQVHGRVPILVPIQVLVLMVAVAAILVVAEVVVIGSVF